MNKSCTNTNATRKNISLVGLHPTREKSLLIAGIRTACLGNTTKGRITSMTRNANGSWTIGFVYFVGKAKDEHGNVKSIVKSHIANAGGIYKGYPLALFRYAHFIGRCKTYSEAITYVITQMRDVPIPSEWLPRKYVKSDIVKMSRFDEEGVERMLTKAGLMSDSDDSIEFIETESNLARRTRQMVFTHDVDIVSLKSYTDSLEPTRHLPNNILIEDCYMEDRRVIIKGHNTLKATDDYYSRCTRDAYKSAQTEVYVIDCSSDIPDYECKRNIQYVLDLLTGKSEGGVINPHEDKLSSLVGRILELNPRYRTYEDDNYIF